MRKCRDRVFGFLVPMQKLNHGHMFQRVRTIAQTQSQQSLQQTVGADTCIARIKQCVSLQSLKAIHASMLRSCLHQNLFFFTNLVARYALLGSISYAYRLFSSSSSRDVFLYNVMIRGLVDNANYRDATLLYCKMRRLAIPPDNFTFPFVIKANGCLGDVGLGVKVHADVIVFGYQWDAFTANSLIAMYGKCGRYELCRLMFDKMTERNVVSWSTMIGVCLENGKVDEGLSWFWELLNERIRPNRASVLNAMACASREKDADDIWRAAVDNGLHLDHSVNCAAIGMYARSGKVDRSRRFFDRIVNKDLVTWSAMIGAYAHAGLHIEALRIFNQMIMQNINPNSITILSMIRASSTLKSFQHGRVVHGIVIRRLFNNQLAVLTSMIDLYVKSGSLNYATKVFDRMQERSLISWSTMISGYGMHGRGREALNLFNEMKSSVKPDYILFLSVLSACSHAGLVVEGWECFNSMARDFGVTPGPEHYACMVDLLGRAGKLYEARDFIQGMPVRPDAAVWGALLGACRVHSNIDLAEMAAGALFDLDPGNPGRYVVLYNIYASSGKREEGDRIRTLMKKRGVKKIAGHTIIEIRDKMYTFVAGDISHPQTDAIYSELERLMDRIHQAGYIPDTNFVLHEVEEETKVKMLHAHSEKLAIVFGLLNLRPGSVIRIRKNLRVCGDCHTATKFISKVTGREIIVRDAHRFHHFKDGSCSCGDYW